MLIFSRSTPRWAAPVFIAVVCVGAILHYVQSKEDEQRLLQRDRTAYPAFEADLRQTLSLKDPVDQKLLFDLYQCGVMSVTEKVHCQRVADAFLATLTVEQRKLLAPIAQKYFSQKP